ncbi:hypothetical protein HanPI659440_Chr01g0014971 [Helianthus annuus]|nr:hypothetical protein HanPI659440_Chr01g0014971 [Helianthus annuus]
MLHAKIIDKSNICNIIICYYTSTLIIAINKFSYKPSENRHYFQKKKVILIHTSFSIFKKKTHYFLFYFVFSAVFYSKHLFYN